MPDPASPVGRNYVPNVEFHPLRIADSPLTRLNEEPDLNPSVSIKLEEADLSIGTARFKDSTPISQNLSMHESTRGKPATPVIHANIEVHLYDKHRREVPMTSRLVRTWAIIPHVDAIVEDRKKWHV
jgi:hypothetical protein